MGKRTIKPITSLLFATFAPWNNNKRAATNGMIEPFLSFFPERINYFTILEQPYPGSDRIKPFIHSYKNGKLQNEKILSVFSTLLMPFLKISNKPGTHAVFKIRDYLSVIEAGWHYRKSYDIFIGLESINALAGVFLRKIGKVKKVAYYCSDFSPNRFQSKIVNNFYLWLDRQAAMRADFIWDVSPAMQPARIATGLDVKQSAPVIDIPNALFPEQINSLPHTKRDKYSVVFVGTIGLENGPDLAIEAFKNVVKKYPNAVLHIIGGGGKGFEDEYLKKLAKKNKIDKNVIFHGFISDVKKISDMIKHYQIAIAPYKNISGSIRLYGDATKIRLYLAAGLPIITTHVPPLGKIAEKKGAAMVTNDTAKDLGEAINALFNNKKKYVSMSENAMKFAKNNTWKNTYATAIKHMGYSSK